MNAEGPKLHVHKPKKAQVKRFLEKQLKAMDGQSTSEPTTVSLSSAAASYKDGAGTGGGGGGAASKPPEVPKESFARRFKFLWPMVLAVNLAIGGYVLFRTTKKDAGGEEEEQADSVPSITAILTTPALDKSSPSLPAAQPEKHEPIPENQQRELFKWMLGEMRKVKPKDTAEKKRIDEEKAFLKQLIRAKEIPKI